MSEIVTPNGLIIPESVQRNIEAHKKLENADLRIVDMVVNVSAPCQGEITDWPANIQDGIYAALMKKCVQDKRTYTVVKSRCGIDDGVWYLHVTAAWKRDMDPRAA